MSLDGFDPADTGAFVGFRPQAARNFYEQVDRFAELLHIETTGLDNIPKGRALLVANHSFGWDVMFPMARIAQQLERPVWALGEHAWWKVPFLRKWAAACGVVDGSQENADTLLAADQLVLVLPGGLREAVKPPALRYQLLWGRRYGFVRAALRNQAPLVPMAAVGTDELFDIIGDPLRSGHRWFPRWGVPVPTINLFRPRRIRSHFSIGEPIPPGPPEAERDMHVVRRLRREIEGALHELIEDELARRAGIDLS